jgi:hypothetical protein
MNRLYALVLLMVLSAPAARAQDPPGYDASLLVPANVRFDVLVTDDSGNGKPLTKVVTLNIIASSNQVESGLGQIRSSARPAGAPVVQSADGKGFVPLDLNLNVDINRPRLMPGNRIRVPIVVEYRPYSAEPKSPTAIVRTSVDMLMDNGKKTVISQSADPVTDRKVIIEVTPTIQR